MISTVEDIRRQYALAYTASLPPDNPAKCRNDDSVDLYVSWWCHEYVPDMVKIARIAQEPLTDLANGAGTETARSLAHHKILQGRSEVVNALLDCVEPLRSVFLSNPVE